MVFLIHEDTLTAASFEAGIGVPDFVFSLPIEMEDEESVEQARGETSFSDGFGTVRGVSGYLGHRRSQSDEGRFFPFRAPVAGREGPHSGSGTGNEASAEIYYGTWICVRRLISFMNAKGGGQARNRWKVALGWAVGMAALVIAFLGVKIAEVKLDDKKIVAQRMAGEVPLVIESQKLLEKLKQNKLGGIDPFGALGTGCGP